MTRVQFVVRGRPVPQGALVRSPNGGLYHRGRSELEAWRTAIADEARRAMGDTEPLEGPVVVSLSFTMPRLRSHYLPANRKRIAPELRSDAPFWHAARPDLDKLCRAALDALTAVVIRDDAQVATLSARKSYGSLTGAVITVEALP